MPNITTCTACGGLYEAGSEEQANELVRLCASCQEQVDADEERIDDEEYDREREMQDHPERQEEE